MTNDTTLNDLAVFLKLHQVQHGCGPAVFALTPSSLAITVQRQQIRALNLVHAICKTWAHHKPLKKVVPREKAKIAIIGGGIAGVTTAAALLKKGYEVHLFEQRSELCHLQSGCETRWLHPAIYDWPSANSDFSDARLPLLNWSAGMAGQVARHVLRQFDQVVKEAEGKFFPYLRANARLIGSALHWDNADAGEKDKHKARLVPDQQAEYENRFLGRGGQANFDVVIIAVGFGVETGVLHPTHASTSYWRNDRFGQPTPWVRSERREIVFISGDGDGGLLDLGRVCLRGFKHDLILDDLVAENPLLVEELQRIREKHLADLKHDESASLMAPLTKLRTQTENADLRSEVDEVTERMKSRLRLDTRAILNGRTSSFASLLQAKGRSFFNVLLAYSLYHLGAFSYIGGKCEPCESMNAVDIDGYGRLEYDIGIRRHGTEREAVLQGVGLSAEDVQRLFDRQKPEDVVRFSERLWPPGWWSLPPEPEGGWTNENSIDEPEWLERVPRLEQALAIAFLGPLNHQITQLEHMSDCRFRLTLHRTLHFKRGNAVRHCYQQVAPYFGSATSRMNGGPGRVFYTVPENGSGGAVGVTIRNGVSFAAQLPRERHTEQLNLWCQLWAKLLSSGEDENGVVRHYQMNPELVTTVLTVPVCAELDGEKSSVRYILYCDIEHNTATNARPDVPSLLKLLWATSQGIVSASEHLRGAQHDGLSLLSVRSAVRDTLGIAIPKDVANASFQWLIDDYDELVSIHSYWEEGPELPSLDEFELNADG